MNSACHGQLLRHAAGGALLLGALAGTPAGASPAVTLTDANTVSSPVTYTAGPYFVRAAVSGCSPPGGPSLCDDTPLTINVSGATAGSMRAVVRIDWPQPVEADFDLFVQQGTGTVASSASTTDPEIARFAASNGAYNVHVDPYQPYGNSYTATIYLEPIPPSSAPPPGPNASYQTYAPPNGMGEGGEPSIGVNWKTGVAVVGNVSDALFVGFNDGNSTATWVNRPPLTNVDSADPILFTDRETGHTVVSQQINLSTIGCSYSSYSDDDGLTWVPTQGCGPPAGADHQAIGGGPHHAPLTDPPAPVYGHAVYYCSQALGTVLGDATCSRSDDGGLTYGPAVVVYTSECGGLHGHPRVAPDGTVYLPNKACAGPMTLGQGVAISTDNGQRWSFSIVPGSTPGDSDPSVATGLNDIGKPKAQASNTIYFGYCDSDGLPKVAVSHDQGANWINLFNVGASAGIRNCVFPEMIAGDDNRAALFFLGTTAPGAFQNDTFPGEWHAYVATTYDGGNSWGIYDATPFDPVQLGPICLAGIACTNSPKIGNTRNLLDFNDISLDKEGRPVFVFADGCVVGKCKSGDSPKKSRNATDTIGRQSGGKTLFAAYDATVGSKPVLTIEPPPLKESSSGLHLFGGGLPLTLLWPLAALAALAATRRRGRF